MEAVKRVCSLSRPPMAPLPAFFFLTVAAFAARDTILPGEGISGNETLVSRNGVFELGFFSPGPDIYHFLRRCGINGAGEEVTSAARAKKSPRRQLVAAEP